ncbi:MAG: phosphoenolpyruvate--protein phosphotransferase [Rhodobacteraceae bacterium]|nr:phosphoenolpyruvate--protein phosphotransferase [Paracoccaceae bacterium]
MVAEVSGGQNRLDQITRTIADGTGHDVCSIYLLRDPSTLELCASAGLNASAVHLTRLRVDEGLVGKVARRMAPLNTANAPQEPGFRFMPETGEEVFKSFLGVPLQRLGEPLGVLVIQSRESRLCSDDEVVMLEVVAMFLADMTELGAFVADNQAMAAPHTRSVEFNGGIGQEGLAEGHVLLHEPRVVLTNPVADDPEIEYGRLEDAIGKMRGHVDELAMMARRSANVEQREIVETYRMFANSRGWVDRIRDHIRGGLSAEAAVEMEQSNARARMAQVPDAYIRERLHDLDDLSNRLLRTLTGQGLGQRDNIPEDPILVARQLGPGELLEYGRGLKGVILEGGSIGSHVTIIARAMAIPLLIHVEGITTEALNGDQVFVDGERGVAYLRPGAEIADAFRNRISHRASQTESYKNIRNKPATTRDGETISLHMNAGVMTDLPNLESSGAEGVGLFRTELRFLAKPALPRRGELARQYSDVLDSAGGKPVVFRTLDIGSDKVLPYINREDEPNPALGWRAIRIGLERTGVLRMQAEALIRGAKGRPLTVMFPLVAEPNEFYRAREIFNEIVDSERKRGRPVPSELKMGAMLETPSLAFAHDEFFELTAFLSIGGNDLKQFFFAADRENERVRSRYDTLSLSYLGFIEHIVERCRSSGTRLSYCGETAGMPLEAICLSAIGLRMLSMRSASIGRVKHNLRRVSLEEVRVAIQAARADNAQSARQHVADALGPALYFNP